MLGSGAVFLESTVVNVGLPAVADAFGLGIGGVQWVVNGYLLTLSALMLLGGSLGDVHRRRLIFQIGLISFAVTSSVAALMPSAVTLVVARLAQGASGALLVPNSLALLDELFADEERGAAIGQWAGWSAVSTAAGPLLGGWLVDAVSWRLVFAAGAPLAIAAAVITARYVPDAVKAPERRSVDYLGAALATLGLGGVIGGLIAGQERGFERPEVMAALGLGVLLLLAFVRVQRRATDPILPLDLFRSRQFTGANLTTLLMYGALGGIFLFLMLQLQSVLGFSGLAAGASLLPINALMLLISPRAGRLAERWGARWPMAAGSLMAAAGSLLLAGVSPGDSYVSGVLPGVMVFGIGLSLLVAPLTAAVLGAVPGGAEGIASAINNAAARVAGLIAIAVLPLAAGIGGIDDLGGSVFAEGYRRMMLICAGLCGLAAVIAYTTIEQAARVVPVAHPSVDHGCAQRRSLGRA